MSDIFHEFDPDWVLNDADDIPDAEQEPTLGEYHDSQENGPE